MPSRIASKEKRQRVEALLETRGEARAIRVRELLTRDLQAHGADVPVGTRPVIVSGRSAWEREHALVPRLGMRWMRKQIFLKKTSPPGTVFRFYGTLTYEGTRRDS